MDFYNVESEFIDSLDYLSPPVKRIQGSTDVFGRPKNDSFQFFREFRTRCTNKISDKSLHHKRAARTGIECSTSLILKKRSNKQVFESSPVVSYTTLQASNCTSTHRKLDQEYRDKPLIKVTVIPKSDQIQTAKYFLRKRRHAKRVESSLTNQANSVQTTNLFVVVAGRRRDKIYEIKTTGSATLSTDTDSNYHKHVPFSSIRELIQSLDMNQNNKIEKKEIKIDDPHDIGTDPFGVEDLLHTSPVLKEPRDAYKNRVKIFGQLGLTDNDRYVLRYGATVNDKPVSDFAQITPTYSPIDIPLTWTGQDTEVKRDISVQANDENQKVEKPIDSTFTVIKHANQSVRQPCKDTQATQVNLNVRVNTRSFERRLALGKDVQCSCGNNVRANVGDLCPKECQSPLVIISVYPKQSPEELAKCDKGMYHNRTVSPIRSYTTQHVQGLPRPRSEKAAEKKPVDLRTYLLNKDKRTVETKKENTMKRQNARSPSPTRKNSKLNVPEKGTDTKVLRAQGEKKSPDRYKAMRVIKNKILEKDKHSPESVKTNTSNPKTATKSQGTSKKPPPRLEEKETNTEHAQTKKVIVDNYTKQLTELWNQRGGIPAKMAGSKVTVNIDGEHEYYNLLLDQGTLTTDLRITKTTKDMSSQKGYNLSASLENLLVYPEKEAGKLPTSIAMYAKHNDKFPTNERVSGITIRDSLEISHRREDKNCNFKNTQTSYSGYCIDDYTNDTDFLAPIKHYTGDDCSLSDPVERDKQIRELLGVDKAKLYFPSATKAHSPEKDDYPFHCFYRRKCVKSQAAEFNLDFCNGVSANRKEATYNKTNNIYDTEGSSPYCNNPSSSSCFKDVKSSEHIYSVFNKQPPTHSVCAQPSFNRRVNIKQKYNCTTKQGRQFTNPANKEDKFIHSAFTETKCVHPVWLEQKYTHLASTHRNYFEQSCAKQTNSPIAHMEGKYTLQSCKALNSSHTEDTEEKYAQLSPLDQNSGQTTCTQEKYTHQSSTEQTSGYTECTQEKYTNPFCTEQTSGHTAWTHEKFTHPLCTEPNSSFTACTQEKYAPPTWTEQKYIYPISIDPQYTHPVCIEQKFTQPPLKQRIPLGLKPTTTLIKTLSLEHIYDSIELENAMPYAETLQNKTGTANYGHDCMRVFTNSNSCASNSKDKIYSNCEYLSEKQTNKTTNTEGHVGDNYEEDADYKTRPEMSHTTGDNPNKSSIYQQLILNRNIQVFLQIEQFSKQRPIVLSRKQYDKVKKTIQNTICNKSSREQRRKLANRGLASEMSFDEIKKKKEVQPSRSYDQEILTVLTPLNKNNSRQLNMSNGKISKKKIGLRTRLKYDEENHSVYQSRQEEKDTCGDYRNINESNKLLLNRRGEYYAPIPEKQDKIDKNSGPKGSELQKHYDHSECNRNKDFCSKHVRLPGDTDVHNPTKKKYKPSERFTASDEDLPSETCDSLCDRCYYKSESMKSLISEDDYIPCRDQRQKFIEDIITSEEIEREMVHRQDEVSSKDPKSEKRSKLKSEYYSRDNPHLTSKGKVKIQDKPKICECYPREHSEKRKNKRKKIKKFKDYETESDVRLKYYHSSLNKERAKITEDHKKVFKDYSRRRERLTPSVSSPKERFRPSRKHVKVSDDQANASGDRPKVCKKSSGVCEETNTRKAYNIRKCLKPEERSKESRERANESRVRAKERRERAKESRVRSRGHKERSKRLEEDTRVIYECAKVIKEHPTASYSTEESEESPRAREEQTPVIDEHLRDLRDSSNGDKVCKERSKRLEEHPRVSCEGAKVVKKQPVASCRSEESKESPRSKQEQTVINDEYLSDPRDRSIGNKVPIDYSKEEEHLKSSKECKEEIEKCMNRCIEVCAQVGEEYPKVIRKRSVSENRSKVIAGRLTLNQERSKVGVEQWRLSEKEQKVNKENKGVIEKPQKRPSINKRFCITQNVYGEHKIVNRDTTKSPREIRFNEEKMEKRQKVYDEDKKQTNDENQKQIEDLQRISRDEQTQSEESGKRQRIGRKCKYFLEIKEDTKHKEESQRSIGKQKTCRKSVASGEQITVCKSKNYSTQQEIENEEQIKRHQEADSEKQSMNGSELKRKCGEGQRESAKSEKGSDEGQTVSGEEQGESEEVQNNEGLEQTGSQQREGEVLIKDSVEQFRQCPGVKREDGDVPTICRCRKISKCNQKAESDRAIVNLANLEFIDDNKETGENEEGQNKEGLEHVIKTGCQQREGEALIKNTVEQNRRCPGVKIEDGDLPTICRCRKISKCNEKAESDRAIKKPANLESIDDKKEKESPKKVKESNFDVRFMESARSYPSSLEIHYTSVGYTKQMDLSTSELAVMSDSSLAHINSFQTIFRGHRKSPTPNLGTSVYSLYTDDEFPADKSAKYIMAPRTGNIISKKPFLMRLMSCLVMRSTRASALKLPTTPIQDATSVNSSVDSYHISTSLGAVEVTSSLYDTTASFYSNHTIMPINSKMKRGFFNSVRGFLTNRKS